MSCVCVCVVTECSPLTVATIMLYNDGNCMNRVLICSHTSTCVVQGSDMLKVYVYLFAIITKYHLQFVISLLCSKDMSLHA